MNKYTQMNQYPCKSQQHGFTLIETLVAGFIMFMVLAAAVSVYGGAVISTSKATSTLKGISVVSEITPLIKVQILAHQNQSSLEGASVSGGVEYFWQAEVVKQSAAPQKFDPELGQFVTPTKIYKLWLVSLTVAVGGNSRTFTYNELSWP
ncbi:prepilin-type N-terminal cleavage/methylation domain-containing protein [Shewanella eurypsychrophilus]|uniref:Prepilin-type N-terminal cleavage/methylation domain-containing protein n=1 Tax=Shewanella eurypsychrophilus TaxID=2593656 RepID=A0ABX6VAV7_9GAMM|nr:MULTISPECIES: prepilin-type N-terminal cleavage/methylation domain-containing protein [Shewanella]QFU23452.1 hypothetical protein FS418_17400 [Shewanella sp. YLB-09]QPG58681.1 prepilin-type N-terminal cleavage/methylation domain-containing protein [Shewanella eurypsychrophilus]